VTPFVISLAFKPQLYRESNYRFFWRTAVPRLSCGSEKSARLAPW